MRNILSLMVVALLAGPALAPADKKDDQLLEISRDIADVGEKVRDLQKAQAAQADTINSLKTLLQQSNAASTQVSQDMAALQRSLTAALADQQSKMSQNVVAPLGTRIDGLATSVDQLNTTIAAMNDRLVKLAKQLSDINDKVSTLNQPAPAPPPPAAAPVTVPDNASSGVPAGITRAGLQEDATRDYTSNNDELALMELSNYVKYYPMDSWAPTAGYLMGMVYKRSKDYDSATQAFQSVIDNYPGNNQAQDALFQKGMAYELWPGHKKEAVETLKSFIDMYPVNDNVPTAKRELAKLNVTPAQSKKRPAAKQQP